MAKKLNRAEKIRRYLKANPHMLIKDVAAHFGTTYNIVYMVRKNMPKKIMLTATEAMLANKVGVSTVEYAKQKAKVLRDESVKTVPVFTEKGGGYVYRWLNTNQLDDSAKDALAAQLSTQAQQQQAQQQIVEEPTSDPVSHPAHYKMGGIETIDFIEAKEFNYNMGNAVKYISRAEHKGNKQQDLEKAIWYLNRELKRTCSFLL